MLVFYSGFLFQTVNWVQHWVEDVKNLVGSQLDLIWRFLTRRNLTKMSSGFIAFPLIPKGVFVGRFTQTKFTINFHLLNSIQNAGQHITVYFKFFQAKAIKSLTLLQHYKQTDLSITSFIAETNKVINFHKNRLSCCNDKGKSPTFLYSRRWQIC